MGAVGGLPAHAGLGVQVHGWLVTEQGLWLSFQHLIRVQLEVQAFGRPLVEAGATAGQPMPGLQALLKVQVWVAHFLSWGCPLAKTI